MSEHSIVVVGIGNILFRDEGIGCYAGAYLEANYDFSRPVDIIDGGTLGFKLMTYYQGYDSVIIVDTVSIDAPAGSVFSLSADELMGLGTERQTAHEVEVVEMLEICSLLERMAEVRFVGIVPDDIISVAIGLTPTLHAAFDVLVAAAIVEIERLGVTVTPRASSVSLDRIIERYDRPERIATA